MADESALAHGPTLAVGDSRQGALDAGARLEPGRAAGEYVIERYLGGGAMGEVYAGRHPVIGKRVAIKVLRHELTASSDAAERFIREARAANQIDHENVIDVFAFGRLDDGRLYLVMDLVDGRSLRAHLVDGALDLGTALSILEPIADALDAAHARGVVHRDLKPDNIVLSNATPPKVYVLDFGIAKLIATASDGTGVAKPAGTLTGAGTWLGTPGYMAPEQWSVDGAGPASDRYALGVIAFELLSGAQPFSASSVPQMMEQHFRAEVPALAARGGAGLPGALDRVLRKALAKDPEQRYDSARAFVGALRDAAGTAGLRARGAITLPADRSKRPWLPAVAGITVLAAGVGAVVLVGGDRNRARPRPAPSVLPAPTGTVKVSVISVPAGAEVRTPDGVSATTPATVFGRPGESLALTVRKPGYRAVEKRIDVAASGTAVSVRLDPIDGFVGVWAMPTGELRAFERRDDHVDAFKLSAAAGPREFFTQYAFAFAASDDRVQFGADSVVADPRAPNEPTCNMRMRVDYVYTPDGDRLEQRREHVDVDFLNGTCVEKARRIVPVQLVRVDGKGDSHELAMPVGTPEKSVAKQLQKKPAPPTSKQKTVIPLDPKTPSRRQKTAQKTAPPTKAPSKSTDTYTAQPSQNAQIVPQPDAPAPQVSEDAPQQAVQSKSPPDKR